MVAYALIVYRPIHVAVLLDIEVTSAKLTWMNVAHCLVSMALNVWLE
jgi:hypothetical protein